MRTVLPSIWLTLLLVVLPIRAETLEGTVVGVIDGDTVDILDDSQKKWPVRLAGIDAPERKQPFGTNISPLESSTRT
jgi:micrococcal nuclease